MRSNCIIPLRDRQLDRHRTLEKRPRGRRRSIGTSLARLVAGDGAYGGRSMLRQPSARNKAASGRPDAEDSPVVIVR
jgi:hypothetical protein